MGADRAAIEQACALLRAGALVAIPTETVYGLGADASNPQAVARIYALKGRPSNHPVIVHLARAEQMTQWARDIPPQAWALAEQFWPGPLTLILPRAAHVSDAVTGGQDSIGLRVPAHPLTHALLTEFGGGVAAPSANRYGRISPTSAAHVREEFGAEAPFILDGGDCTVGLESTIVSLLESPQLLRPGGVPRADLVRVLGTLGDGDAAAPRAPGTTPSHYAPATPLRWISTAEWRLGINPSAAVLAPGPAPVGHVGRWIEAAADPQQYGHDLYAVLRTLDRSGAPEILVVEPPALPQWEAVRDRLRRSAAAYSDHELP